MTKHEREARERDARNGVFAVEVQFAAGQERQVAVCCDQLFERFIATGETHQAAPGAPIHVRLACGCGKSQRWQVTVSAGTRS